MTDSKHTPGPWKVVETHSAGELCVETSSECGIAQIWRGTDADAANARLIAAAPEMYSALESLIVFVENTRYGSSTRASAASALLAKIRDGAA